MCQTVFRISDMVQTGKKFRDETDPDFLKCFCTVLLTALCFIHFIDLCSDRILCHVTVKNSISFWESEYLLMVFQL